MSVPATPTATAQELVEAALERATLPVVVRLTERWEANLRWAANELTTNGEMHGRTLTVVATAPVEGGTAVGTVSQEVTGVDEVPAVLAAAERAARSGPPSENAAPLVQGDRSPAFEEAPATTGIEVLARVADGLGDAFAMAAAAAHLLYGFAEHVVTTTYLGSTTGLRLRGVQPTGRFELNGKTADLAASAWVGAPSRDFTDVDVAALYGELRTRLRWAATRIDLPAGRYETLLPPGAVADLLVYLLWTANARDAEEGRNVFSAGEGRTRLGERLAQLPLTLRSDPAEPGLEAVPFVDRLQSGDGTSWVFDVGLPVPATTWVTDGVLTELVRNRAQAAASGSAATPPADNLVVTANGPAGPGTGATLEEMVARTERGLLVTCLWYIREVDPERLLLTGLTRDGVYLVEHGEVKGAVNNFRWNESPVELLGRITEVGASESTLCREWNDFYNRTVMPPVRVPDFNMSTVSRAS
ncbi:MAG: TldE/PmbA family protein, Actinobacterial subgroup [uncultured Friedmanniella sp.]|uniref:TldE/PmbA family protein, Actinobacterial subgroup n=1 Tax=uncultured Friedmanniella sp. TaxID=335381 RepID=A0A6J4KPM2_9ACTN|nr:MAG: TldE/PmbA family protein, Actinobacterial subgroup [uncultured Friedmanniella sp.]